MNQSLKLHLYDPIDPNMEIKRKLDDLENDISSHIGRLQEIDTKREAVTISLVSCTFLQFNWSQKSQRECEVCLTTIVVVNFLR